MANLRSFRRIVKEDFPEDQQQLVDRLGYVINDFAEQITNAFNKNLDFNNLNQELKLIELELDSNGLPKTQIQLKNNLSSNIKGMICIRAENLVNPNTYPTGAIFVSFSEANKTITIKHITGLQADQKYRLQVITIG